jgi:virulence-associated protein VagC
MSDEANFSEKEKKISTLNIEIDHAIRQNKNAWNNFFLSGIEVSEDFMSERAEQKPDKRDAF